MLACLLFALFVQLPFSRLRQAFADRRFLLAAVAGNFLALPVLVWILMHLAPADPAVRLGLLLVLLLPCTDWFIGFTGLGRGDPAVAVVFSPLSLLLQVLLLPFYLWLFLGEQAVSVASLELLLTFALVVLFPLLLALLIRALVARKTLSSSWPERLAWFPVPLLSLVVLVIAATQVTLITASTAVLVHLALLYMLFLLFALLLARVMTRLSGLPVVQGRTLAFSFGTRNSFVVLPVALALPQGYELAVLVIVLQSLVELLGMACYLWLVPGYVFPDESAELSR